MLVVLASLVAGAGPSRASSPEAFPAAITHVFVIVEENHDWSSVKGNDHFPYITSLLSQGAHAENYHNVPEGQTLHPSEPNYIMLEAGDTLGLTTDHSPSAENSSPTTDHLVTYLERAGITWTSYQEGISGTDCPLKKTGKYAPKHNPMVFFQDVTDGNSATSARCIEHVRPYSELESDLANDSVASYSFVAPDLCNDMHDPGCDAQADAWLSRQIPMIMASKAYKENGAIFLTWDEGQAGNNPIGMIVLSPLAKPGYANTIAYSHASLLRTIQDIFGVQPYLGAAADATNLGDLFVSGSETGRAGADAAGRQPGPTAWVGRVTIPLDAAAMRPWRPAGDGRSPRLRPSRPSRRAAIGGTPPARARRRRRAPTPGCLVPR